MSKSNDSELDILKYAMQGVAPSWAAASNVFASLHTADPGETGNQSSNEAAYTGYTRVTISRSTTAWTTSGTTDCANLASIAFPACTAGTANVTHVGVGTDFSGTGKILYSGALSASLAVSAGITPSFDTASLTISED